MACGKKADDVAAPPAVPFTDKSNPTPTAAASLTFPPMPLGLPPDTITAKYDKFRDDWLVTTARASLKQSDPPTTYNIRSRPLAMYVAAAIYRSGEHPVPLSATDHVMLLIVSDATDWQFLGDHTLRLIADGQRYKYDTVRVSQVSPLQETLAAKVPIGDFLKIVSARAVEGQVGVHDFSVPDAARKNLLIFASVMATDPHALSQMIEAPVDQPEVKNEHVSAWTFRDRVKVAEANPKFYVDEATRTYHEPGCKAVTPRMPLITKPIVVLNGYRAHSCVATTRSEKSTD